MKVEAIEVMEDYTISQVTSQDDVHAVAAVFVKASQENDSFGEMVSQYGSLSPLEGLLKALKESLETPNHHVFKVVHQPTGEVVGMTQWKAPWYLEVDKGSQFANVQPEVANHAPLPPSTQTPEDAAHAAGVAVFNNARRQIGNAYTTHIGASKHVFLARIAVLPDHQKRGIASRLMEWGTDVADAHGIVSYLNGRPAALKLYENFGFKPVLVTHFKFEDLEVAPVTTMLRQPVAGKKI